MINPRELDQGRHPVCVAMPTPSPGEPWHNMTVIRFGTSAPNVGEGKLHVEEVNLNPNPAGTPSPVIFQRIYEVDKTPWVPGSPTPTPRLSVQIPGRFTFHAAHAHTHLDNWTHMRLVKQTPTACGGDPATRDPPCVVGNGRKLSFCLEDSKPFDGEIKATAGTGGPPFAFCGSRSQGINPGKADVYTSGLSGQLIDITGVPSGNYWLEAEVDPTPSLVEVTRANNAARVLVAVGGECVSTGGAWHCSGSDPTCAEVDCRDYAPDCCRFNYGVGTEPLTPEGCRQCKEYYCYLKNLDPDFVACGGDDSGCE